MFDLNAMNNGGVIGRFMSLLPLGRLGGDIPLGNGYKNYIWSTNNININFQIIRTICTSW